MLAGGLRLGDSGPVVALVRHDQSLHVAPLAGPCYRSSKRCRLSALKICVEKNEGQTRSEAKAMTNSWGPGTMQLHMMIVDRGRNLSGTRHVGGVLSMTPLTSCGFEPDYSLWNTC